jgi:hypothetical protein
MSGKASPFRKWSRTVEAAPRAALMRRSLKRKVESISERQSLSAHQAAEPRLAIVTRFEKNKAQKQKDLDALAEQFKNANAAMLV